MLEKTDFCNSKFLGSCLGLTQKRVQQLTKDGIIPRVDQGKKYVYDLMDAVSAYCKYLRDKAYAREKEAQTDPATRIKAAKADQLEMMVEELKGNMYRSEDVEAIWNDHILTMRGLLLAMPGQLANDVNGAETAAEAAEIIKTAVFRVLTAMSRYEFDPRAYEARVRERQGWDTYDEDIL